MPCHNFSLLPTTKQKPDAMGKKQNSKKKRKPKKREQGKSLWTVIGKLVVWVGTAAGQLKLNLVAAHKIYDLLLFQLSAHITTPPTSLSPTLLHSIRNFCDSLHAHTQAHTFYLQFCQAHWKRISTYINHLYAVDCPAQHPYAHPPTHFRHNKHKIKLQSNSINKLSTFSAAYA